MIDAPRADRSNGRAPRSFRLRIAWREVIGGQRATIQFTKPLAKPPPFPPVGPPQPRVLHLNFVEFSLSSPHGDSLGRHLDDHPVLVDQIGVRVPLFSNPHDLSAWSRPGTAFLLAIDHPISEGKTRFHRYFQGCKGSFGDSLLGRRESVQSSILNLSFTMPILNLQVSLGSARLGRDAV